MNYNKADFMASYGISSQLPDSDRPEISFSGRSNVGKSSLINKLCSRKNLARVSAAFVLFLVRGWVAAAFGLSSAAFST